MADDVELNAMSGGDTCAADDIGGVKHQRVKIEFGGDGSATEVSAADPLPAVIEDATVSAATPANVSASASSTTLFAADSTARGRMVYNDSAATLYLKYGATASATSFTVAIPPGGYLEFPAPLYTGVVDGIWTAATGAARVTEV